MLHHSNPQQYNVILNEDEANAAYRDKFEKNGFFVAESFFDEDEINVYREIVENFYNARKIKNIAGGKCVPGWVGKFEELKKLSDIVSDTRISKLLTNVVFGSRKWRFLGHSDLHQDKISRWHRDDQDLKRGINQKYKNLSIKDSECLIVKMCFFLQDHHNNEHGLWMQPNSQLKKTKEEYIASKKTDVIVFDQRLAHRGQMSQYRKKTGKHRYLITLAFGLDNEHGKAHELGADIRQTKQINKDGAQTLRTPGM